MTLPFEITYSEKPGKKPKSLKRLAIIVKPENVTGIADAIRAMGLDATIYDVRRATKEKERVTTGRGIGTAELSFTTRKVIATVVNSDDVEEISNRMKKALNGDKAVIMIQSVDDLLII